MQHEEMLHAQFVMKCSDGSSILEAKEPTTSKTAGQGDLSQERVNQIKDKLCELGFRVDEGNMNTLSISGPASLFIKHFGMEVGAKDLNTAVHATRVSSDLAPLVADVFIPPAPQMFQ